jgi:UDP-glucose 4-epimerase
MKKILITGGNGLIGYELIRQIEGLYKVTMLVREEPVNKRAGINYVVCDLSKEWNDTILPKNIDCVVHLAQSEKFREFPGTALDIFNVNTLTTLKLLNYARNANATNFIYASSGGVYGNSNKGFVENEPLVANKDLGFYLGTKLCSEILVESYANIFNSIILRFFFVYGKNQRKTMLIPRLVESVKSKTKIILQGENGIVINPIHVSDAAKAVAKSIEHVGSNKYNISGNENLSLREIAAKIGTLTDSPPVFDIIPSAESKDLIGDNSKMIKELHKPEVSFSQGVRELI